MRWILRPALACALLAALLHPLSSLAAVTPTASSGGTGAPSGAPVVVVATVLGSVSESLDDGVIRTRTTMRVDRTERGSAPAQLDVLSAGGTIGDITQVTEHEPIFRAGQQSRLQLQLQGDAYDVVGGERGKHDLTESNQPQAASCSPDGSFCLTGQAWATGAFPIPYHVNSNTSDLVGEEAGIHRGLQLWTDDPGSTVSYAYQGATSTAAVNCNDGQNVVYWRDSGSTGFVGRATYCFTGSTLTAFDVEMNDNYPWSLAENGETTKMDVATVATHEAGHALGLNHPTGQAVSGEIMFDSIARGTVKRALGPGDTAGIRTLYPGPPGPADPVLTMAGPANAFVNNAITYTLTVRNQGGATASNVIVTDTLPNSVSLTSVSSGCTPAGTTVTCDFGALAGGAQVSKAITISSPSPSAGLVNAAQITSASENASTANDAASVTTQVTTAPRPNLTGVWTIPPTQTCSGRPPRIRCRITGTYQYRNDGNASAGRFSISFLRSADAAPGDDTVLKTLTVRSLAAGFGRTVRISLNLPRAQSATGQYVLAQIDPAAAVYEHSESDNLLVHGPF